MNFAKFLRTPFFYRTPLVAGSEPITSNLILSDQTTKLGEKREVIDITLSDLPIGHNK